MDPGYFLSLAVISTYGLRGRRSQASNNAAPTSAVTTQNSYTIRALTSPYSGLAAEKGRKGRMSR